MKKNPYYHYVRICMASVAIGTSGLFVYHLLDQPDESKTAVLGKSRVASRDRAISKRSQTQTAKISTQNQPEIALQDIPKNLVTPRKFQEFNDWAILYSKATPSEQQKLLVRGEAMIRQRHEQMANLIEQDPQSALDESDALSPLARNSLPESLKQQLEQPVNARADLNVVAYLGQNIAPYKRFTKLDGQEYTVFPAGKNEILTNESNRSILGIKLAVNRVTKTPDGKNYPRVDRIMVLRKDRVRVLSKEQAIVERQSLEPNSVATCDISAEPITASKEPAAIETGGDTKWMCQPDHITEWLKTPEGISASGTATDVVAVGGPGEGAGSFRPVKEGWSTGNKTFLCIRFRCKDQPTTLYNELDSGIRPMLDQLNRWSYGRINFTSHTLSPLLVLPRTFAEYQSGMYNAQNDAWAIARSKYDLNNYSFQAVCVSGLWPFGGSASIGGSTLQINNPHPSVFQHELGHCLGLPHANLWDPTTNDPLGPGQHGEYGGSYDTMGHHWSSFNTVNRFYIRWLTLPESHDLASRTNGTYKIYDPDVTTPILGRKYTIRVPRSNGSYYFVEFRPRPNAFTDNGPVNLTTQNGIRILRTDRAHLIDVTPLSKDGAADAALVAGREFYDVGENITIKAVAKGGSGTDQYFDVQVLFSKPPAVKTGRTYAIRAIHSNQSMGVQFTSSSNGAPIWQVPLANRLDQKWMLMQVDADNYKIVNINSGKVLEVSAYSTAQGAAIQQWSWTGTASQKWQLVTTSGNYVKLINVGSGLALTVPGASNQVGTQLQQFTYTGASNQQWSFDEMSPLDSGSRYGIIARHSGKAMTVDNNSSADGASILQWSWLNVQNQNWTAQSTGGAGQSFTSVGTGKVFEVGGYSIANGGYLNQYFWANHDWQKWRLEAVDSDSGGYWYQLINVGSGKVADVMGVSNADGARIYQYPYWSGLNQQWRFVRVN